MKYMQLPGTATVQKLEKNPTSILSMLRFINQYKPSISDNTINEDKRITQCRKMMKNQDGIMVGTSPDSFTLLFDECLVKLEGGSYLIIDTIDDVLIEGTKYYTKDNGVGRRWFLVREAEEIQLRPNVCDMDRVMIRTFHARARQWAMKYRGTMVTIKAPGVYSVGAAILTQFHCHPEMYYVGDDRLIDILWDEVEPLADNTARFPKSFGNPYGTNDKSVVKYVGKRKLIQSTNISPIVDAVTRDKDTSPKIMTLKESPDWKVRLLHYTYDKDDVDCKGDSQWEIRMYYYMNHPDDVESAKCDPHPKIKIFYFSSNNTSEEDLALMKRDPNEEVRKYYYQLNHSDEDAYYDPCEEIRIHYAITHLM